MKKNKIIILITTLIITLLVSVGTFAYFKSNSDYTTYTVSKDLTGDIITIDSYQDLVDYSKSEVYNDYNDVATISNSTANRKTLQLTTTILLTNDIEFSANANLDLNGNYLYLNGYSITFSNYYYGTFQLYSSVSSAYIVPEQVSYEDGTYSAVSDGTSGFIIINTPNAIVTTNENISVVDALGTSLTLTDYIITIEEDNIYTAYNAFYLVADSLVDYTDVRPDKLKLTELTSSSLITSTDDVYTFDSSLFIPARTINDSSICEYSTDNHACSFVFSDIDLPFTFYNYESISITYESSDTGYLSDIGKVTLPDTYATVTLNANILVNDVTIATCSFEIHIVNPESSEIINVAKTMFYSRISEYYSSTDDLFEFDREILLPSVIETATLSYLPYQESTDSSAVTIFDDSTTTYLSLGTSSISTYDDRLIDFSPTSELAALAITITYSTSTTTFYIKCDSENLIVNNETSIARDLVNEWYGGTITLSKTDTDNDIYSTQILYSYDDIDTTNYPGITAVSYELINDTHSLYQITDITSSEEKLLSVISGKTPEAYVQDVVLGCVFTINSKSINIQINIKVSTGSSDTASAFLPYYTYYDEYIKSTYNNYISQTFELPFSYSNTGPIICYDFVVVPSDYQTLDDKTFTSINPSEAKAFSVKLYYNGAVQLTLSYTEGSSYTDILDATLGSTATEIQSALETILSYGDAKWIFDLNIENVANSNTSMALIYNYKNDYTSSAWTTYCVDTSSEQIITKITLAGILHYGTDVVDETFYGWIYNNFTTLTDSNGDLLTYSTGDYTLACSDSTTGSFILIDWLSQNVSIDASSDSVITSISDFTGLKFLTGSKYLKLVDSSGNGLITDEDVAISLAQEIAKMTNLETLILTNCSGFTDGYDTSSGDSNDNDSISRFVALRNLTYLDMQGCNVYLFEFLESMTWLSEIHIENQVVYSNDNYNNFFGNTGIANYSVFIELTDAGVSVYNTYQGSSEVLFEEEKAINDYTRLKNGVLYQSQLFEGEDITNLYNSFSTSADDYLLATTYSYISGSSGSLTIDTSTRTITWSYVEYGLTSDTEIDSTKTYYIKDSTSSSGYSAVSSPTVDDIDLYYEHYDETTAVAFQVVYHFELTGSTTVEVNLTVKFKVERLANE